MPENEAEDPGTAEIPALIEAGDTAITGDLGITPGSASPDPAGAPADPRMPAGAGPVPAHAERNFPGTGDAAQAAPTGPEAAPRVAAAASPPGDLPAGPASASAPALKVLNTRPEGPNRDLTALLRKVGFEPVEAPMVEIVGDPQGQERARGLSPAAYTGIFLSSPNGLRHLQAGLPPALMERWIRKPFFLVGPKAAEWVERAGGEVAFVPKEASLEGFLKEYKGSTGPGGLSLSQRWLHPCSASTRLDPLAFRKRGIEVENVHVYRPAGPPASAAGALASLAEDVSLTAVLFCSGSSVEHFHRAAPALAARLSAVKASERILAISIGPSTTRTLRELGVKDIQEAPTADNDGLLLALMAGIGAAETRVLRKGK